MLVQRRRSWTNISPALLQHPVLAVIQVRGSHLATCHSNTDIPAGTIRWSHVDPMLGHRRRRWANIGSAWGQRIMPAVLR